jgi:S-adenosylmethionine/arginine decarboxylase-like enzyme
VVSEPPRALAHVSADLTGVSSGALRDAPLLSGLLIAAASAAGLNAAAAPVVRTAAHGGVSAILMLEPCHLSVHCFPDRSLALLDVLTRDATGAAKALEVFVRRLAPTAVTSETRMRG